MQNLLLGSAKTETIPGKALKSPAVPVGESGKAAEKTPGKSTFLANLMFAVEEIEKPEKILKNSDKKSDPTKMLVKETNKIAAKNEGGLANLIKTETKGDNSLLKSFAKSVENSEQKLLNASSQAKEKIQQRFQSAEQKAVESAQSNQPKKLSDILKLAQAKEIPLGKVQYDEPGKSSIKIRFVEPLEYKTTDEKPTLKVSPNLTQANNIMLAKKGTDTKLVSQHTLVSDKTPEMPKAFKGSVNNILAEKPLTLETVLAEEKTEKKTPFHKVSSKLTTPSATQNGENAKLSVQLVDADSQKESLSDKRIGKIPKVEGTVEKHTLKAAINEVGDAKTTRLEDSGNKPEKKPTEAKKAIQELTVEIEDTLPEKLKNRENGVKQPLNATKQPVSDTVEVTSGKSVKTDFSVEKAEEAESIEPERITEEGKSTKKSVTLQSDMLPEEEKPAHNKQAKEGEIPISASQKQNIQSEQTGLSKPSATSKESKATHTGSTLSRTGKIEVMGEKTVISEQKAMDKEEVKAQVQKEKTQKQESEQKPVSNFRQQPLGLKERATPTHDLFAVKESLKPADKETTAAPKKVSPLQQLIQSDSPKETEKQPFHETSSKALKQEAAEKLAAKASSRTEKSDGEPERDVKKAETASTKNVGTNIPSKESQKAEPQSVQVADKKLEIPQPLRTPNVEKREDATQTEPTKKTFKETAKNSFGTESQKMGEAVQNARQESRQVMMENRPAEKVQMQPMMQNEPFNNSSGGSNQEEMKRKFGREAHLESGKETQKSTGGFEEVMRDVGDNASGIKAESAKNSDLIQRMAQSRETIRNFSMQLSEEVKNYKPPISKITLELNPEKLGSVEVTITTRGNNVQVNLNSNPNAMMMLMQNNLEFKNSLANLGFNDVQMNFSSGGGGQGQKGQQEQRNGNGFYHFDDDMEGEQIEQIELILPKYI